MKKKIAMVLALIMLISIIPNAKFNKYVDVSETYAATQVTGAAVVDKARNYIGPMTYIPGGMDLTVGCDCSGFVCAIYRLLGVDFVSKGVRSSYDMWYYPEKINAVKLATTDRSAIRNGDLVITNAGNHVGIGTDNGHMIHQSNSRLNEVREIDLKDYSSNIVAIIRIDYTKWGGTNATNLDTNTNNDQSTDDKQSEAKKVEDKDNPGFPYAVPNTAVSFGSNSNATMWLQTALNKLNSAGLDVDGSFGRLSETAVKNFQSKYGIEATGIADNTTIDKLIDMHKALNGITKVEIVEQNQTGSEGDILPLTIKVTPETTYSVPIVWTSSNGDVAIVDSNGAVALIGEGDVGIIATAPNGVSGTTAIKVTGKTHFNEWHNGRWYGADGKSTYQYTGSWKQNTSGWWFEDTSGWYPVSTWQKIDGKWYYFGSNGYNYRKGWTKVDGTWYYFKKTGEMAESEWIDGYWLSANGGWSYTGVAQWKQNSTGWWYEDSLGWYPVNETITIDGVEYTFNSAGYWVQNVNKDTEKKESTDNKASTDNSNTKVSAENVDISNGTDSTDNLEISNSDNSENTEIIDSTGDSDGTEVLENTDSTENIGN